MYDLPGRKNTATAMNYLIVFFGAGLGGVFRFLMSQSVQRMFGETSFPIGTFSVNMAGCFIIGFLAQLSEAKGLFGPELRVLLFVGILGGYTTFSSFAFETFQLIRDGEFLYAAANAVLQTFLGLLCVWAGWVIARLF